MSVSVECPQCGIERTIPDESIAHDLAEGHEELHGHHVRVRDD